MNGKKVLVKVYVGSDDICYNNKINNNNMMVVRVEEENTNKSFEVA
jgi:hypothetical protein